MLNTIVLHVTLPALCVVGPSVGRILRQNIHRKVLFTQLFRMPELPLKFLSHGTCSKPCKHLQNLCQYACIIVHVLPSCAWSGANISIATHRVWRFEVGNNSFLWIFCLQFQVGRVSPNIILFNVHARQGTLRFVLCKCACLP
jgi:hypothetical protein